MELSVKINGLMKNYKTILLSKKIYIKVIYKN